MSPSAGRPPSHPRNILHALLAHGRAEYRALAEQAEYNPESWKTYVASDRPGTLRAARLVDLVDKELVLGPGLGLVLAFSVGAERLRGALVTAGGEARCVVAEPYRPDQLRGRPEELLTRLGRVGAEVLRQGLLPDSNLAVPTADGRRALRLIGATAAWPSPMDHESWPVGGTMLHDWRQRTFREHLHEALGLGLERCHAINDANAGALTMAFEQETPRAGALICVHVAAGIGLGTVHQAIPTANRRPFIDAHVVGGAGNQAGEIGHCAVEPGLIDRLNRETRRKHPEWNDTVPPLNVDRICNCGPARGHMEAVVGAEAVLDRLGRLQDNASQAVLLKQMHKDAAGDPRIRHALQDVGRVMGSTLAGTVAATDPVAVELVGALASEHIADGMNQQLRSSHVRGTVFPNRRPDAALASLRGAALAVLRGGLYRVYMQSMRRASAKARFPEDWPGWDTALEGTQSGQTQQHGSAWRYEPMIVDADFVARMAGHAAAA